MMWAWLSLFTVGCRLVRVDGGLWLLDRPASLVSNMDKYETHEYDVVVVGAWRCRPARRDRVVGARARTVPVCKSLLGKAHTVMAEGGIAAALANVDSRDTWQMHFRDTMKGGKFLNSWRMAQLNEQCRRVRELEAWVAVFDRTRDGNILQRNFGGHTYPRLAHVGDRTGLEMIRTLQDRGVHQGIDVYMECTIRWVLQQGGRAAGCFGYWRESGRFIVFRGKAVVLATGGIGRLLGKISSNSWEYTGDGHALAYGLVRTWSTWSSCSSIPRGWFGRPACAAY